MPFLYTRSDQSLQPDPLDDVFRAMAVAAAYEQQPPPHHPSTSQYSPHPHMPPPPPHLDPSTLAWLQLLQAQAQGQQVPPVEFDTRDRGEGTSTNPATAPTASDDGNAEDDDEHSEGERSAITDDKRRRNTAASGMSKTFYLVAKLTRDDSEVQEQEETMGAEPGALGHEFNEKSGRAGPRSE